MASAIFVPYYAGLDVALGIFKWLKERPEWKIMGRDHFLVAGRIMWEFRRGVDKDSASDSLRNRRHVVGLRRHLHRGKRPQPYPRLLVRLPHLTDPLAGIPPPHAAVHEVPSLLELLPPCALVRVAGSQHHLLIGDGLCSAPAAAAATATLGGRLMYVAMNEGGGEGGEGRELELVVGEKEVDFSGAFGISGSIIIGIEEEVLS